MLIEFEINDQKLTRLTDTYLADQSNNLIQCHFTFKGDDWNGKQRFAILYNHQCTAHQLHIDNTNTITIPYEIVEKEKFSITIYGEDLEENRITTNLVTLHLDLSGYTTDIEDLHNIDPDIWTQIWSAIDGKSDIGHTHKVNDITDFPNLSDVALSGEYSDLKHKPSIPVNVSELVNDAEYVNTSDNRLSDNRDPNPHTHLKADIVDFTHLHPVRDIIDFPSIPSKISDLTNDSDFISKSNTNGLIRNDGTIDTTQYISEHQDLTNYIQKNNTTGLIKNDGSIDTNQYLTTHQDISGKINYTDIVDNLTTNDSEKPLSAKQGKQLADMIGEIQTYVNR